MSTYNFEYNMQKPATIAGAVSQMAEEMTVYPSMTKQWNKTDRETLCRLMVYSRSGRVDFYGASVEWTTEAYVVRWSVTI